MNDTSSFDYVFIYFGLHSMDRFLSADYRQYN